MGMKLLLHKHKDLSFISRWAKQCTPENPNRKKWRQEDAWDSVANRARPGSVRDANSDPRDWMASSLHTEPFH